jgi:tetratricopeptide (TPR) repeat protein
MLRYNEGDYVKSIAGLEEAAAQDPSAPNISFFLGVSYLLQDQIEPGIAALERTIAVGTSPYLEEAHLYRAKGLLRQGNAAVAREALEVVVELEGRLAGEAKRLMARIDELHRRAGKAP